MKIILFGATGMVGQGALREALLDPEVEQVLAIGRSRLDQEHPKLCQRLLEDLSDLTPIAAELSGYDSCWFCLGVSAAGLTEASYRRVTYDLTLSVARTLQERNPGMTFIYVSGNGADATERGGPMWARVKGATENALLAMPFKRAYMFRPGLIQPLHGIVSKTRLYRLFYKILGPLLPACRKLFPAYVTTTEEVGKAMLYVAKGGVAGRVLENRDIAQLGAAANAGLERSAVEVRKAR